jgi:hypothetical protein
MKMIQENDVLLRRRARESNGVPIYSVKMRRSLDLSAERINLPFHSFETTDDGNGEEEDADGYIVRENDFCLAPV